MLLVVYKEDLISSLNRVAKIVKTNPRNVDILQCVKIETMGEEVFITATSPMASARVLVPNAIAGEPGAAVVNLDRFKDRISKAAGAMRIESDAHSMKIVSSEDQKLGLALNILEEFPTIEWAISEESYGLDRDEWVELLLSAASQTANTTALTPAFLQVKLENQFLWVSSGVSYQKLPVNCNPELVSAIPTATLGSLVGFIKESEGDTVWLSQMNEDDVVVTVGKDQFQAVPLALKFPDVNHVFDQVRVTAVDVLEVDRKRLITELTRASTSTDEYGRVTLTLSKGAFTLITIKASSPTGDWFESEVQAVWGGGGDRVLTFNLDSLLRFLKSFSEDAMELKVGDDTKGELSPIYCTEGDQIGILNQFRI